MRLRLTMLAAAVISSGCSTTASILTKRGLIEGRINGGDASSLFVATEAADEAMVVPREEVFDLDHPGNVAAIVGGILGGYGLLNIAVGAPGCGRFGDAYCAGVFLPASVGLPMFVYGLVVWTRSRSAAEAPAGAYPPQQAYPSQRTASQPIYPSQSSSPSQPIAPGARAPLRPPMDVPPADPSGGANGRCSPAELADMRSHGMSESAISAACTLP